MNMNGNLNKQIYYLKKYKTIDGDGATSNDLTKEIN